MGTVGFGVLEGIAPFLKGMVLRVLNSCANCETEFPIGSRRCANKTEGFVSAEALIGTALTAGFARASVATKERRTRLVGWASV